MSEDDDDEGGGRLAPPKKSNALLIGSIFGVVVLGGILFLIMRGKKTEEPPKKDSVAQAPPADVGTPATAPSAAMSTDAAMSGDPAMSAEPGMDEAQPAAPAAYVAPSRVQFHVIEHRADTKPEERVKIDELVQKAVFENAGSDSRAAATELVGLGLKAAPRVINVFSTVKMGAGFDDRLGKIECAVADGILRRIDGYIERSLSPKNTPLKGQSDTKWVEKVARYWISWWDSEKYLTPQKPWDERIDGNRDDAPAGPAMDGSAMDGSAKDPAGMGETPAMSPDGVPEAPPAGK